MISKKREINAIAKANLWHSHAAEYKMFWEFAENRFQFVELLILFLFGDELWE